LLKTPPPKDEKEVLKELLKSPPAPEEER